MEFAYQASLKEGQVPVLFVLKIRHREDGEGRAYLHDENSSAHPEEEEFLLGDIRWEVFRIEKETEEYEEEPLEVTVIEIKEY